MPLQSLFGNNTSQQQSSMFDPKQFMNSKGQYNGWTWDNGINGQSTINWNGMQVTPGINPLGRLGLADGSYTFRKQDPNSPTGWSEANYKGSPGTAFDTNSLDWHQYDDSDGFGTKLLQGAALAGAGALLAPVVGSAFGAAPSLGGATAATDPLAAYMTTGASEGSTIGGSLFGGGSAGAVGSGSLAGTVGSLQNLFTNPLGNQAGNKMTGNIISNLVKGTIGGNGGGISTLGNLGSLFTNYNQYKQTGDLMNQIKGIYSPDSPYAKYMEEQLGRKDAAAGRNSQYGPRLAQLMGILGEGQARSLSGLFQPLMQQQGGLNGMVGAGSRLLQGSGLQDWITQQLGGGSQGGMLAGELGQTPSTWDRVGDNVDWESLFGG